MTAKPQLAALGGEPAIPEDLKCSRWPLFTREEADSVAAVLTDEGLFGSDTPQVTALEQEWRDFVGAPYCRAVSSGTAGLHLGLWAAGVGPGDEVLVPAYSFMSTALAILHAGAIPVFVDVDLATYNLDPERIETHITPASKAILVVHLHGLPADMDAIMAIAQRHGLAVVEDCAHAHGATYKGRKTGTLGDAASFSINGAKNMPAGEAGLWTTRHPEYLKNLEGLYLPVTLGATQESAKYPLFTLGYNYRCSVVGAAVARAQLRKLDQLNGMRQANAERLSGQLRQIPGIITPVVPADRTHVFHMYRVRFDAAAAGLDVDAGEFRARVVAALGAEGILGRSWMNWTLPELPIFADPEAFEQRHSWRRTWDAERTYSIEACPNARRMVEETAVLMDVPVAATPEVVDRFAEGFHKVFSQLDEVMKLPLTPALRGGDLASCQAIRAELG